MIDDPQRQVSQLARVRLFEGLDRESLSDVSAAARAIEKERDALFFRQGQEAKTLFVILKGRVKATQITPEGHQIVLRFAGAGEMFGCVPLYGGKEYPATAKVVTPCHALAWNRPAMDRLMKRHPQIAINALVFLGEELAQLRSRYQELSTERVEQRVARALIHLLNQAGKQVEGGVLIEFPLSRQDLAELTGTTLHTVSRILSVWERKGLIESGRRRVLVRKPLELVAIAEGLGEEAEPEA